MQLFYLGRLAYAARGRQPLSQRQDFVRSGIAWLARHRRQLLAGPRKAAECGARCTVTRS